MPTIRDIDGREFRHTWHVNDTRRITIIGGGLAGPLLACLLADDGHEIHVLERRGDPRADGYDGGRSINLALSARGLQALDRIGLKQTVLDTVVPMYGRMMHDEDCRTVYSPYSYIPGEAINSVSRGGLNCMLLDAAQARSNVTLSFDIDCTHIDVETCSVTYDDGTGSTTILAGDLIVGADGAGSMVRQAMHAVTPIDSGTEFIDSGYKELTIPAGDDGSFQLEPNALHIWPRGHYMMIALPNSDGSFTCTCFWPIEGTDSFANVDSPETIQAFFSTHFPDAAALMPQLVHEYNDNPVGPLGTVHCSCYHHEGTAVLLGDAAHAIVPFFGQGMNAAFQDCLRLASCLSVHEDQRDALKDYNATQLPDGDAIGTLSLSNFIEMRDKTASPLFRCMQRIRKQLSMNFPSLYMPRYNLVSFTTMPYANVIRHVALRRILVSAFILGGMAIFILIVLLLLGTI